MVCEAVPGAKGAQRRRKVFIALSYLTFSDTDFQPCNIFTLVLVTVTAHKPQCSTAEPVSSKKATVLCSANISSDTHVSRFSAGQTVVFGLRLVSEVVECNTTFSLLLGFVCE